MGAIDDDEAIRAAICQYCATRVGKQPAIAENGGKAFAVWQRRRFGMVGLFSGQKQRGYRAVIWQLTDLPLVWVLTACRSTTGALCKQSGEQDRQIVDLHPVNRGVIRPLAALCRPSRYSSIPGPPPNWPR